jgi:8-oxo-dGTP pyrophosphatase MutT (NUDIX family)
VRHRDSWLSHPATVSGFTAQSVPGRLPWALMSLSRSAPAPVVPVRHAATVLVIRDRTAALSHEPQPDESTIEVLPGAYVFPGGAVDPSDLAFVGVRAEVADVADRVARVAAIRECLEEAGVLLIPNGITADGTSLIPNSAVARRGLLDDGKSLAEVVGPEAVRRGVERLVPLARWVTPTASPRRFDTRFYVVGAPPDAVADHDDQETIASRWFTPREALAAGERGELLLITPTRVALSFLSRFGSAAEALRYASRRS